MNDLTRMLNAIGSGDWPCAEALLPCVYEELRQLAARRMAREAPGHTLQPTALVHEAWLRLFGSRPPHWGSRAHFFAAAAEAMRRILVEHARRKHSQKRGGGLEPIELQEDTLLLNAPADELLAVHEALDQLAREDPAAAELVKLRYFVGLTMEEVAEVLGVAKRTAEGLWTFARAWLRRAVHELNRS
ncbi:MAG: ECF-type sigma factor [Verrucomicrobia bacterium]|nr:ECF-type sigma factor [Verrucomicrobiota bacterium]